MLDAERGFQVRQLTGRLRQNKWEIKNSKGDIITLTDAEFNNYRIGAFHLPWWRQ